jgi:hypothetical protein
MVGIYRSQRFTAVAHPPQREQVLHHLFAQVVVYPVHLRLGEARGELARERVGRVQVDAERLLDNDLPTRTPYCNTATATARHVATAPRVATVDEPLALRMLRRSVVFAVFACCTPVYT